MTLPTIDLAQTGANIVSLRKEVAKWRSPSHGG